MITLEQCRSCEDDFYNDKNPIGVKRCWHAKSGEMVTRYRIGTWTQPTQPGAFTEVRVPSCCHQKGYALYKRLPDFVKLKDVIRPKRAAL